MKVVIKAASVKMGGALTYLCDFLRHAATMAPDCEYVVLLPSETIPKLPPLPKSVRLVSTPSKGMTSLARLWWEQVSLRKLLREEKPDLFYATGNLGIFHCPVRQLLLVEGLLYFSKIYQRVILPRHSLGWRVAYTLRRWLICRSVRSADVVMTPTQAMLDELRDFVDVPPHKALVNPYGVDPPESSSSDLPLQSRAGLSNAGNMCKLLYVSLYAEHKNLSTLLKAMPLLNEDGAGKFLLQTTADPACEGAAWTVTHGEDTALAQEPGISPWAQFLGPLSREQTERLYLDSDIFVFPSLTESFGFPMAEAMSYGLPIVASDTPVNREVCGEAAVYFSPLDPEDLARQVRRVAADAFLRQHLSARGQQQVRNRFRWNRHVERILDIASRTGQEAHVVSEKPGQCPLCGGEQNSPWSQWDLLRCNECALVFDRCVWRKGADLEAETEWFEAGYAGPPSPWVKIFEKLNNQRTFRRIAPSLRNGARLLEVGVGTGSFLEHAKRRRVNVTGCDSSRAVCEDVARRLHIPVLNCSVDDLPNDTKYDVVVMNHVLEHVGAPTALLEDVRSRMNENGLVHIATSNVACWEARLSGWGSYEPYHSVYFSPDTIRKTLEKSGFTVLKVFTHEPFSAWFLTALRTLLGTRIRRAERRYAAHRWRSASWVEHAYRACMVFAGVVSFPLRRLQASLGYGDELVVLCTRGGQGLPGKTDNGRGAVAIPKPASTTIRGR